MPLWLDEGLAEYFELPPENKGINYHHLDKMNRATNGAFKADLVRLEQLDQVAQMKPAEYREAWAWVCLMLHGKHEVKTVLLSYIQQLRTERNPGPLRPHLREILPDPEEALEKYIAQLDAAQRPSATSQR